MIGLLKRFIGAGVGKIVLTAQLIPINQNSLLKKLWGQLFYNKQEMLRLQNLYPNFIKENESKTADRLEIHRFNVKSTENVELDTVELLYPAHKQAQKYIIYGWGRSDCYEKNLKRLATDALNLNAHIISFNYRGVAHSSGRPHSETDLVDDYYQQIKRLVTEKNVLPENIYCYGHSLGGAVSILAADKAHKNKFPINIYSDRSFSNLINVSRGVYFEKRRPRMIITQTAGILLVLALTAALAVCTALSGLQIALFAAIALASIKLKYTYPLWDKTLANFLDKLMQSLMKIGNWNMDVAPVFDKLPDNCKSYTVTKGPKPTRIESSVGLGVKHVKENTPYTYDKVIHHRHALHTGLKHHHQRKKRLKGVLRDAHAENASAERIAAIKAELLVHANNKFTGGSHMDLPSQFITRYPHPTAGRPITAQEKKYDFIEPDAGHIQAQPRQYKVF